MAQILIEQIAGLFLMMGLGFIIVKKGLLKKEDSKVLSVLCVYLVIPAVIINSFQIDFSPEIRDGFLLSVLAGLITNVLSIGLMSILDKMFGFRSLEKASVIYSNAGNLIIPLIAAILGTEWVIYASGFMMVQTFFLWTHGLSIMSGKNNYHIRSILTNINLLSIFVGLILFFLQIKLPNFTLGFLKNVSAIIGPISMIMLGMIIAGTNYGNDKIIDLRLIKVVILRLIIVPISILLIYKFSGMANLVASGKTILFINLLANSAPSATTIVQLSQLYNNEPQYASRINLITTLLSIVTMPLLAHLYYM